MARMKIAHGCSSRRRAAEHALAHWRQGRRRQAWRGRSSLGRGTGGIASESRVAAGKSLSLFHPRIYFHLILLAQVNIWDNLSRIFWDKGPVFKPWNTPSFRVSEQAMPLKTLADSHDWRILEVKWPFLFL